MKNIFKQDFETMKTVTLEVWKPTKQQKYASAITNCIQLGIKIPNEMLEEYNKTIENKGD